MPTATSGASVVVETGSPGVAGPEPSGPAPAVRAPRHWRPHGQAVDQDAMDRAVAATDGDLDATAAAVGSALLAAALALAVLGVRPRLREFA